MWQVLILLKGGGGGGHGVKVKIERSYPTRVTRDSNFT